MTPVIYRRHEITGGHVLAILLLFFSAIISMNVVFSIVAVRTFPGEDERRSYLQGLRYNETLKERAAEAALGWRAVIDLYPSGPGAQLQVHLVDRNGAPVDGLSIEGNLRRPATTREDRPVVFTALGNGVYTVHVGKIAAGVWVLHGSATRGAERFTFERRMTWTPAL